MLSSLLAQKKQSRYELIVDVAHMADNGTPSTEELALYFSEKGLIVRGRAYNDYSRFKYRGLTRNDQIASCDTDFLLFADTDMVYHNRFFFRMMELLFTDEDYKNYDGILTCGRWSQDNPTIEKTNELVDYLVAKDPVYIKDIWSVVDRKLDKVKRSNVGAGFFQLINMGKCDHGGIYVPEDGCKDYSWEKRGQKAKSDQQFKRRIGMKKKLPAWYSEAQIHVNHYRDNMFEGRHLEDQR